MQCKKSFYASFLQKHFFLVLCKYLSSDFSSFGLTVPLKATEQSVCFHLSCLLLIANLHLRLSLPQISEVFLPAY